MNRAAEVWWALLAIADEIGGDWPGRARAASRTLGTGGDQHDDAPDLVMLLGDICDAFGEERTFFTETLLRKLNAIEEHPWGARRRGEGLDARGLSKELRPLGIRPRTIGSGKDSAKGYRFDQFTEAFRHLAGASHPSHPSHLNADGTGDATLATDATDFPGSGSGGQPPTSVTQSRHDHPNGATPDNDGWESPLYDDRERSDDEPPDPDEAEGYFREVYAEYDRLNAEAAAPADRQVDSTRCELVATAAEEAQFERAMRLLGVEP